MLINALGVELLTATVEDDARRVNSIMAGTATDGAKLFALLITFIEVATNLVKAMPEAERKAYLSSL